MSTTAKATDATTITDAPEIEDGKKADAVEIEEKIQPASLVGVFVETRQILELKS